MCFRGEALCVPAQDLPEPQAEGSRVGMEAMRAPCWVCRDLQSGEGGPAGAQAGLRGPCRWASVSLSA